MPSVPPLRSALGSLLLFVLLALLAPVARATCGAEGCPFVRDGLGSAVARFAFDLRYQDVTQDALWNGSHEITLADAIAGAERHGEVELYTRSRSWVGEGRARVTNDLTFTASLPYVNRTHRHWLAHTTFFDPRFVDVWRFEGLGDLTLLGHYRVLHRQGGPAITLQGGIKLPTGRRHVPGETQDNFGFDSTLEPSARPGTGSTDWVAGALVNQALPWKLAMPVTASVLGRWNGKGTDDFKVGNELQVGLSGGIVPRDWLTVFTQLNFAAHASEVSSEATEIAHSGMRSLFLTPGVTVRVARGVSLYGLFQGRLYGESDAATVVGRNHWVFGTTYSFGR